MGEKYNFLEKIFSVKNSVKKTHKIWTILGLKIKVKYKQECKRNFLEHIFSIKNSIRKKHKIITILWIQIKIKYKKECDRNFFDYIYSVKTTYDNRHKVITILGISVKYKYFEFNPLVSVIVPNYNHAPYLKDRLDSIYKQTYKNIEVIILDDCSTDNSVNILKHYEKKHKKNTKLYENTKNSGGVFYQWKKGLELAKGEIIWIAESDDWCDKNFLETLVHFFKDEMTMVAFCKTVFMKNGQQTWSINEYLKNLDYNLNHSFTDSAHQIVNKGFAYRNIIPNVSSAIFRNTGFKSIINNKDWYGLKVCGDWMFYLDLIKGGKITYSPNTVNYFRRHDNNTSIEIRKSLDYFTEHEIIAKYVSENYKVSGEVYEKLYESLTKHLGENCPIKTEEELRQYLKLERFVNNPDRKLNILMTGFAFKTGGGETFPIFLANRLKELGHSVSYWVFDYKGINPGIKGMLDKSIPIGYRNTISIKRLAQVMGIDIIHTGHLTLDYNTVSNKIPDTCKHVVTCHGMYNSADKEFLNKKLPLLMREVDKWMYIADRNLEPFKEAGFEIDEKFSKIPNGLPQSEIHPIDRKELGIDENAFVLSIVSRALPQKGWAEAVESIGIVREKTGKDVHLVLLGDGQMYDTLKGNVPEYIHLMGFKQNTRDYIAMSDAFLLSSKYKGESFPLVIIDALFCGKPVISSNVGEVVNMLTYNGQIAGHVFDLEGDMQLSPEYLADNIIEFMNNKVDYTPIINELKKRYTIEKVADEYVRYYESLIRPLQEQKEIYIAGAMCTADVPVSLLEKPANKYLVGNNTGNLVIGDFSRKLFKQYKHKDSIAFPFEFDKDLDYINNNCERIIVLATNWLAEYIKNYDFEPINEVMPKIKVPITVLGLGSNIKLCDLNKEYMQNFVKDINPSFVKFMHLCAEKSESISVRGYITQELLHYIGIDNVDVTGCPTWYVNKENNIRINKKPLTNDSGILFSGNQDLRMYYPRLAKIMENYVNSRLIIQTEFDLLHYIKDFKRKKYPNNYKLPDEFFRKPWGICHTDTNNWAAYVINNIDLSFGFRIHNTIMTLKQGKPAIIVSNDSRTKEMSEFYSIPSVSLEELDDDNFSLEDTYNRADFSVLEREYHQKYENYKKFLTKNGIVHDERVYATV